MLYDAVETNAGTCNIEAAIQQNLAETRIYGTSVRLSRKY